MFKILFCAVLFCSFISSCGSIKINRGISTYFRADSTAFTDSLALLQTVVYPDIEGLSSVWEEMELLPGETHELKLTKPTIFKKEGRCFIVYPGDSVLIHYDNGFYRFQLSDLYVARNNDMKVLELIQKLEKLPSFPVRLHYTYDLILKSEEELKVNIVKAASNTSFLIDSLCRAYDVSESFPDVAAAFFKNRYDIFLLMFYEIYRDTLAAHNVYTVKLNELLAVCNGVQRLTDFNVNIQEYTNRLYAVLFPNSGIWSVSSEEKFRKYFDNIASTFSAVARDYLLSRLMYSAAFKDFRVTARSKRIYHRYSQNAAWRKIVAYAQKEQSRLAKSTAVFPNVLLALDAKSKINLDTLLWQHNGKYVFVDLWASWCPPCIRVLPALQMLAQTLPPDRIVFFSVSLDADIISWRKHVLQMPPGRIEHYLLLNKKMTALYKQLQLSVIPRYLLYDTKGVLINADAPGPDDPSLIHLLQTMLYLKTDL